MDAAILYPFNTEQDSGATCRLGKTFTEVDNSLFAGVTGNFSPVYMDSHHCRTRGLDGRLLFETLIAGLASTSASDLTGGGYAMEKMSMQLLVTPLLGTTYHAEATMGEKGSDFCDVSARVVNPDNQQVVATVDFRYKRL